MYKQFEDRTGERYGRLTILEFKGIDKYHNRLWKCKCDCGNEKIISWRELSRGHTQSCGCLFRENLAKKGGWNKKPYGESSLNQLFITYKNRAKIKKYEFSLEFEEFRNLVSSNCFYCGTPPLQKIHATKGSNGALLYNGIDRVDNQKGYVSSNVRPCCKYCNFAKNEFVEYEFITWLKRSYEHLKKIGYI